MSKETIDIPILGMDRRLSERQSIPGLCDDVENLQPTGAVDRPYWKKEPVPSQLSNDSDVVFTPENKDDLVSIGWHTRSAIGKFAQTAGGSLRRIVCFYGSGAIHVYDPGLDWQKVVDYSLPSTTGDSFSYQYTTIGDLFIVSVVKNGSPDGMYALVDDLVIEYKLPELPVIQVGQERLEHTYLEIKNGNYEGLRSGYLYVRYALKLQDGTLVKHSEPILIRLDTVAVSEDAADSATEQTTRLLFYNDGYRQVLHGLGSEELEFWRDHIAGVSVQVGGYRFAGALGAGTGMEVIESDLKDVMFYEVASFDSLDPSEKAFEDRIVQFKGREDEIMVYPLAEIDNGSWHDLMGNVVDSYNSRLLLGGTQVDFAKPDLPLYQRYADASFYVRMPDPSSVEIFMIGRGNLNGFSRTGQTNLSGDTVSSVLLIESELGEFGEANAGGGVYLLSATIDTPGNPWSITLDGNKGTDTDRPYSVTITDAHADGIVPHSAYSFTNGYDLDVVVDIDAGGTVYRRKHATRVYRIDSEVSELKLGSHVIRYPDRRAKRMTIYETGGSHIATVELQSSNKLNIAYNNRSISTDSGRAVVDDAVNQDMEYKPDRVQISETNAPFSFLSEKTYYIGKGQKVTAFGSNTLAISEGQFGVYPLYVFCENSIWALEQSRDPMVTFERISPVSLGHGVARNDQVVNLSRSVCFVYGNSVYQIYGDRVDEIGQAIANYPKRPSIDYSSVKLGGRKRDGADELLLSDGVKVYIYSTKYNRWYQSARQVQSWSRDGADVYHIGVDGLVYDHQAPNNAPVTYRVVYRPVHFGMADKLKRVYVIYLRGNADAPTTIKYTNGASGKVRQGAVSALRIRDRSAYEHSIELSGTINQGYLEGISAQVEARYPHKNRVYV